MSDEEKILPVAFYRLPSRREPVRDWLKSDELTDEDRYFIGESIKIVEFGWPIGMPTCRSLGDGLREVRINLDHRIARVLFCIHDGHMVLLHGFIKKTQKTPAVDLALAKIRKRSLEQS